MALLEALTLVIQVDASQLDRKIDDSEQRADNLKDALAGVENQSRKSSLTLGTFAKEAFEYFGAFLSVTKAFSLAGDRVMFVGALNDVSATTKIAIEDVDAFGKSLESIGGKAEQANATLTNVALNINRALNEADGRQAKIFASLGVSLKDASGKARSTMDIILELSEALAGMDRAQATARLAQLGITDVKSIELILKGRKELEALMRTQRQNGVVTKDSADAAARYEQALNKLQSGYQRAKDALADLLIPALGWLIDKFGKVVDWANEHSVVVVTFFTAIATALTVAYLPAMAKAAAATWALVAPYLAIAAPIAAVAALIALLTEDVLAYMDGNDSLIGQILDKFPVIRDVAYAVFDGIRDVINFLIEVFQEAVDGIRDFINFLIEVFQGAVDGISDAINFVIEVFHGAVDAGKAMVDGLVGGFQFLSNVVDTVFNGIANVVKSALGFITKTWEKISGIVDKVADFLGFGGPKEVEFATVQAAQIQLRAASANPMNSVTPAAISNSSARSEQNISIGEVTVQTQATDAQGISRDIGSELGGQLQSLQTESATGVVA